MNELQEEGRTISAATAAKLRAAHEAIGALLALVKAEESDSEIAEATKTEDGEAFPAGDYAYVPDPDKPSTWKLRLTATPGGEPDSGIVGAACAALGPGFRGQKVDIPSGDLATVKAKVRAAWRKASPDKDADEMPDAIKESSASADDVTLAEEHIELIERAVDDNGLAHVRLIAPGWGSSGYYPIDVLRRDGPQVFRQGLQMHLDHQTEREAKERPEGSVRTLAGVLASDARWEDDGAAGPGLYADAKVFEQHRAVLNEMAPHIGVSIRATGKAVRGEAEGRKGHIIETITTANTTDYVTRAGAGGVILPLAESADDDGAGFTLFLARRENDTEANMADNAELDELRAELARTKEALLLREARDVIVAALSKIEMPEPTRARLIETLSKAPPVAAGMLDADALKARCAEAATAELEYLVKAANLGAVRGMGASASSGDAGAVALKEAFRRLYVRQGIAPEAAAAMTAESAARGR